MYRTLSLVVFLAVPGLAFAQRDAKIPDPDPEIERKTFIVPDGFEVNLFAADPMLAKPIQMNFDPAGRLWVAASEVYPQIMPGQQATDRVLILEDANNDGVADKTTVFADGLLIPTGVVPGDGGVYVADSTELVHFSDPDPATGKARKKKIVLSGFGTEDTHHIVHTFRWGPWGDLHFSQSIYIHSHIETPHGPKRLNAGGVWAYRPRTQELSVLARGLVNTWGTAFDRSGRSFWTDGAGGDGINILMPGMYGVTAADAPRILNGLNPGSPKQCGLAVASGRHLPDDWQQDLLTNDFRGHRVCRFKLKEDGAGYQSLEQQEVIKSNHPAFRPIDVAMGPDGAIYIADWYNPIIQHGEVDFRDPRRDKTHGRIWRVTAKNRPLVAKQNLSTANIPDLLEALKSPEDYTRDMARRVLREHDADAVVKSINAWLPTVTDEQHKLEAAFVLRSLDRADPTLIENLLQAKDHAIRGIVSRMLAAKDERLPKAAEWLISKTQEQHPQVRLEAIRALTAYPSLSAAQAITASLVLPQDRWLDYATWLALRELAPQWLESVKTGSANLTTNPQHLVYALQAAGSNDVGAPLLRMARNDKLTATQRRAAWLALAKMGNATELTTAFAEGYSATPENYDTELLNQLVTSLSTRKASNLDPKAWQALDVFANDARPEVRHAAYRLVGLTRLETMRVTLETKLVFSDTPFKERSIIAEALVTLGGAKSIAFFTQQMESKSAPELLPLAVVSLAQLDAPNAAPLAAQMFTMNPAPEAVPLIVSAFVSRKGGGAALAKAVEKVKLPPDTAKLALNAVKANAAPDAALLQAFTKAGDLTNQGWKLEGKELTSLLIDVRKLGDPARGEIVYRRADMNCRKCHAIAGAGGNIGPDMSSIGASAPVDYLLESLLLPNAKIKEGYNSFDITTVEGKIISGIKVRETATELVLRNNEGVEIKIAIADIEQRKDGASLMPAGLVDPLTRQELIDLTRFLSELGKGAYAATPGTRVRRWEAVVPTPQMYTLLHRDSISAIASGSPVLQWVPAYSNVNGELPATEMQVFQWKKTIPGNKGYVRFQVEASNAGPALLTFNDATGVTIWLNGQPQEVTKSTTVNLKAGLNTIILAIQWEQRPAAFTLDVDEVPTATTRPKVVGGK